MGPPRPEPDAFGWTELFDALPLGAGIAEIVRDSDGRAIDLRLVARNQAADDVARAMGDAPEVGSLMSRRSPDDEPDAVLAACIRVAESGEPFTGRFAPGAGYDGLPRRWTLTRLGPNHVMRTVHELTPEIAQLLTEAGRFDAAFNAAVAGMAVIGLDGRVVAGNRALAEIFGLSIDDLGGRSLGELAGPVSAGAVSAAFEDSIRKSGDPVRLETRLITPHGDHRWAQLGLACVADADGLPAMVILHLLDVSDAKQQELQLAYAASHDSLTGLPNRALVLDHLALALQRQRRGTTRAMVLFADLDHFKVVNDSLGHTAGDRLLQEVAARFTEACQPGDTVARFGGDEFVMVCDAGPSEVGEAAAALCQRLLDSLRTPIEIEGHSVVVRASIGVRVADDAATPDELLRDADAAMYEAKAAGRSTWAMFDAALRDRVITRLETETQLRQALATDEIRSYFQPVVDLATGRTVGFEALARWSRDGKLIGPNGFLEMAEETGLVVPLTERVAWEAATGLARWRSGNTEDRRDLWLSFNVSARQITAPGFSVWLEGLVAAAGLPPAAIVLEVTERTLLQASSLATRTLHELRDQGYRIAVDDFGTGYSSLGYLRSLPVDILKIDRVFIAPAAHDPRDRALLRTFVQLADALGLEVIAEGIETPEEAATVLEAGCRLAQGYQLARPSPELGVA